MQRHHMDAIVEQKSKKKQEAYCLQMFHKLSTQSLKFRLQCMTHNTLYIILTVG